MFRSVDAQGNASYDDADVIAALEKVLAWKAQGYNIRSVNMSLGYLNTFQTSTCTTKPGTNVVNPYTNIFARLNASNIVPVVSAGNSAFSNGYFVDGSRIRPVHMVPLASVRPTGAAWVFRTTPSPTVTTTPASSIRLRVSRRAGPTFGPRPGANITAAGSTYSGTSQAAPHVAAAVAVLAATVPAASAASIGLALSTTGPVVYDARSQHSTHRLDVNAAALALAPSGSDTTGPIVTAPVQQIAGGTVGSTVPVTVSWSATDPSGIASYELWVSTNGSTWVRDTSVPATATSTTYTGMVVGKSYRFFVRAYDQAGNVSVDSAAAYGPIFSPSVVDDRSTAIAYAGLTGARSWAYASWTAAYKGTLTVSTTAGEYARYTFTGRDIAYVASLGNNRGKAKVFIDGILYTTVDLNQGVGAGARVAVTRHWASSGTHTIDIQTIASSGRPTAIDVDAFVVLK